jgi:Flp pilus assembly protein CpaB
LIGVTAIVVLNFNSIRASVSSWWATPAPPPPGTIGILVAARTIPAYGSVEPTWVVRHLKDERVVREKNILTRDEDVYHRVPIVDILPGTAFREDMFAPKGTQPGLAAGIDPGFGAVTLQSAQLEGPVAHLKIRDNVVVLAYWPGNPPRITLISEGAYVLLLQRKFGESGGGRGGNPLVSHGGGGRGAEPAGHEITLALPGKDLIKLAEAQGTARLRAVLLTGHDAEKKLDLTSLGTPRSLEATMIEMIQGDQPSVRSVRPAVEEENPEPEKEP